MNYELARELPFANIGDKVWVHGPQKYIEVESTKYEVKRFVGMGNYDDLDDYILEGWIKEVKPKIPLEFYVRLKKNLKGKWIADDICEEELIAAQEYYKVIKVKEIVE